MCGLLGFSGDPKVMADRMAQKMVLAKMKILGLYNQDRGRHSCGLYIDNDVYKGVDDDKLFSDFIKSNEIPAVGETSENYVVIGHTRMATHGVHNYENAHPFVVTEKERKDALVLAHNGVIRNVWNLCNKYKVNHSQIRVDSLGLAHLIYNHGFKILEEYEGFAALLMYKSTEPNSLYMYRGMSRMITDGEMREERPLFYMQTEEGIYVSSLEGALLAISDGAEDKVKQVEGNIVQKITNGKMTRAKTAISRESINVGVSMNTHGGSPQQNFPKPGSGNNQNSSSTSTPNGTGGMGTTNSRVGGSYRSEPSIFRSDFEETIVPLIWHETVPKRALKGTDKQPVIFYQNGRYWQASDEEFTILHGEYKINKKGAILDLKSSSGAAHNWFFYEGLMMKNKNCYMLALEDEELKNPELNFACIVSKYSEFPVCNMRGDTIHRCKGASAYVALRWYKFGAMCKNEGFTPKFCDRAYVLREGLLHAINNADKKDKEDTIDVESLKKERLAKAGKPTLGGVIVNMPIIRDPKFNDLPFPPPAPIVKTETLIAGAMEDVTNFYRTWETLEEARSTLTELQINSLRYFCCDVMAAEMSTYVETIHDDNVDLQLDMFLLMCIEAKMSIIDMWDTQAYEDVYYYLKIAKDNPKGTYMERFQTNDGEAPNDACEFVPKPLDSANPKDDVEPPVIDAIVETARVPNSNIQDIEPDEEDDKELLPDTIMYSMQDIVDNACLARECADELQAAIDTDTDSDLSNSVAKATYTHCDNLLKELNEVAQRYPNKEFSDYLKMRQMKSLVKSSNV